MQNEEGIEYIGALGAAASTSNGEMDEFRVKAGNDSAAWIKFKYHNIFQADNELTFGNEEASGWTHIIYGVPNANIAKVNGILKANIAYVNSI